MRGELSELPEGLADDGLSAEKQQEQQLMNKLAAGGKLPARPASSFLQKKLQQRKFFDSGDYAMDKDKGSKGARAPHPMAAPSAPPKPVVTSTEAGGARASQDGEETQSNVVCAPADVEAGLQIPRPETVPQRKASIINPSVHCKLSPMPHVQHHDGQAQQSTE